MKKLKFIEIILILIFIISLGYIGWNKFIERKETKVYDDIKKIKEKELNEPSKLAEENYLRLKDINKDLVGWININNTSIDYPILQTEDNEFYLNHDINKDKSKIGSIYVDYEVNLKDSPKNIIIYGHNMNNDSMFSNLDKFKSKEFYKDNSIISINLFGQEMEYKIFGVCIIDIKSNDDTFKYNQFVKPKNNEEVQDYIEEVKMRSLYDTGEDASLEDEFITLSTCSSELDDFRLIVVGKKINI